METMEPATDLRRIWCPEGHEFTVPDYVWQKFHIHGCNDCLKSYPQADLTDMGFAAYTVELPHSEVCVFMHVAGVKADVLLLPGDAAQIYIGGKKFSAPVTRGEAGVPYDRELG